MKSKISGDVWEVATSDGGVLSLEMSDVADALYRAVVEVPIVNSTKAPELLGKFHGAYLILSRQVAMVQYELNRATSNEEKARSIFMLDRLPTVVQEKGLSTPKSPLGTEDIRSALLQVDEDYCRAEDLVHELKCIVAQLLGKLKTVEMAYYTTKEVFKMRSSLTAAPLTSDAPPEIVPEADRDSGDFASFFGSAR